MPGNPNYDDPPWTSTVNFEMPVDSNVHVLTMDMESIIGSGELNAKPADEDKVALVVKKGEVLLKNYSENEYSFVMTLPESARCTDSEGGVYGMTWYTTDDDNEMIDIFTFVVHVKSGMWLRPFKIREKATKKSLRSEGACWAMMPDTHHPDPFPDTGYLQIAFPITGDEGQSWRCGQGFGGGLTHYGDMNCHSVDFECEEGTTVVAVLPGVVTAVEDSHENSGGHVMHLFSGYNQVIVAHEDGTEACYLHLQRNSILVTIGQAVIKGQHLASTGSVGFAPWPHIHFQLNKSSKTTNKDEIGASVPFVFESPSQPFIPVAGYDYSKTGRVTT
eukprot:TRINITY_DN6725_c0_g1_i1.p1 TRINITY_DN6725_c0_g1~~TRINITY_DN6725_c0_g1_i1.p1  ORF type:complete len:332 (+),score=72.80 TRINITY_DN6725_c0_g1_i1:766-1761(+)